MFLSTHKNPLTDHILYFYFRHHLSDIHDIYNKYNKMIPNILCSCNRNAIEGRLIVFKHYFSVLLYSPPNYSHLGISFRKLYLVPLSKVTLALSLPSNGNSEAGTVFNV